MIGREVRRVPKDWEHPMAYYIDDYLPLKGGSFSKDLKEWLENKEKWDSGFIRDYITMSWKPRDKDCDYSFEKWYGIKPCQYSYMPEWTEKEKTHYQMYETCSEGTPISPVMETPEELAHWLEDNNASAFADIMTASYEEWLSLIKKGN